MLYPSNATGREGSSHWINVFLRISLGLVTTGDMKEEKEVQGTVRCRNQLTAVLVFLR